MLDPPFLELEYYVGLKGVEPAYSRLAPGCVVSRGIKIRGLVGLVDKDEELDVVGGVVILRTEGESFCGPEPADRMHWRPLGQKIYKRFLEVAQGIPCIYGAILVEYSLEEPSMLRDDPRSLAFIDFVISTAAVESRATSEILHLAGDDAYIEKRGSILYVSMSPDFNPESKGPPVEEAMERSARISAVVGDAVRL